MQDSMGKLYRKGPPDLQAIIEDWRRFSLEGTHLSHSVVRAALSSFIYSQAPQFPLRPCGCFRFELHSFFSLELVRVV